MLRKVFFMVGIVLTISSHSQQTTPVTATPALSKAFENPDPELELARLRSKRENLVLRLNELQQAENPDPTEIQRVQGLIKYIDAKITTIQNHLNSVEYAQKLGMPVQGTMTDEEYQAKLQEWKYANADSSDTNKPEMVIQTTLTREEFERLPKERQEKILSMPERYIILD